MLSYLWSAILNAIYLPSLVPPLIPTFTQSLVLHSFSLSQTTFMDLPYEIKLLIFDYFENHELILLAQVSREFSYLAKSLYKKERRENILAGFCSSIKQLKLFVEDYKWKPNKNIMYFALNNRKLTVPCFKFLLVDIGMEINVKYEQINLFYLAKFDNLDVFTYAFENLDNGRTPYQILFSHAFACSSIRIMEFLYPKLKENSETVKVTRIFERMCMSEVNYEAIKWCIDIGVKNAIPFDSIVNLNLNMPKEAIEFFSGEGTYERAIKELSMNVDE
jgi:hypothetical protein